MQQNGAKHVISARPSDAIALAVRMEIPIFAEEKVLDEAGIVMESSEEEEIERFRDFLSTTSSPRIFSDADRRIYVCRS